MIRSMKRGQTGTRTKARSIGRLLLRLVVLALAIGLVTSVGVLIIDRMVENQGRSREITFGQLAGQARFDCVIVPGALVHPDGTPSAMLRDRLDMAVAIYQSGCTDRILVSGDHGRADYNEVGVMRQYLLAAGIPDECIFMDHAGFDTYDTLYRAQAVFAVRRAVFTTQDFQLYRALYISRQLGLDVQGIACAYPDWYRKPWYRFREYFARCKAFLDCEILHASPTYTGPVIPIGGDGRLTAG